jgi:hypothetical protein
VEGYSVEQYGNLQQTRERPHVLDDYTVGRVIKVITEQSNDLWLYRKPSQVSGNTPSIPDRVGWRYAAVRLHPAAGYTA